MKEFGQTTIEYILLISAIVGMILLVVNSSLFNKYVAGNSFMEQLATKIQFNYRHALSGNDKEKYPPDYQRPNHVSYKSSHGSHFFGPADKYPSK